MHIANSFANALQSIWSHKMRSFLTVLGILIGVAAVVSMFATVSGIQNKIAANMEKMGLNNTIVITRNEQNQNFHRRGRQRFMTINRENKPITIDDYNYIRSKVDAKNIFAIIETWEVSVSQNMQKWHRIRATSNDFFSNKSYNIGKGRLFNSFEEKNGENVCILGPSFSTATTKADDFLGKMVSIGRFRLRVIGILASENIEMGMFGGNQWERQYDLEGVYIPVETGAKYISNNREVQSIHVQAHDEKQYMNLKTKLYQLMLAKHNMTHDFAFQDIGEDELKNTQELKDMIMKWQITLISIASISLFVGGIGLFSTLLISINEKMLEIGIRKSCGANEKDIFGYFIAESVTLSILGAITGILLALIILHKFSKKASIDFSIPSDGVMLGLGFSLAVGILFGLYPAWKAAKIDPIKAIFYFE